MRDIKFRVFKHGSMEYTPEIPYSDQVDLNAQIEGLVELDYVVMQYTGLTDKNGVDIYEGDIVEYNSKAKQKSKIWQHLGGEWQVYDRVSDETLELYMEKKYLTVIGNMHENKELLEKK